MSGDKHAEAPLAVFKGLYFFLHGPNPGLTRNGLAKLIKQGGGKVLEDWDDERVSHVILSGNYWAKRKTTNADLTLKRIMKKNEDNRTVQHEDHERIWLLPLEWVRQSLEEKKRPNEREHDYERVEEVKKAQEEAEKQADQAKERRGNKGKSRYGRGERVKHNNALAQQKIAQQQAALEKSGNHGNLNSFSGIPAASGYSLPAYQAGRPPVYPPAFLPIHPAAYDLYNRYPATLGAAPPHLLQAQQPVAPVVPPALSAEQLFAAYGMQALKERAKPIPKGGFKLKVVNPVASAKSRELARQLSFFSLKSTCSVPSPAASSSSTLPSSSSAFTSTSAPHWRPAGGSSSGTGASTGKRPTPSSSGHDWGQGRRLDEPEPKKRRMEKHEDEEE